MFKKLTVLCLLFCMPSCVLHPPYARPCVEIPENWRLPVSEASVIANVNWWAQFNDPVLNELILEALENNNDLKIAIARVSEFWSQYKIVRSQLLPQIFGTGSELRQEQSLAFGGPLPGLGRTFNTYNLAINLAWEVDLWGRLASQTEAALANYFGTIEARRTVVLALVSSVASSYVLLRQYDMQLEIAKKTQISRENSLKLAVDRYEGGLTSELEVKQAASLVDTAIVEVKQIEIQQAQEENFLSVLLGRPSGDIIRGLAVDQFTLPFDVPAGLPSQLLEQRPDIIQAEQVLVATNALWGAAMADAFPKISLTGLYGNSSFDLRHLLTGFTRTWQLGSSFLQSVYSGGRITGEIEVADAQFEEALYAYEQTILTGLQEVNDALIANQKTKEITEVQKHQVQVLTDYLQLATLQYDNGQTDYLNVLDAERTLFISQLNYAQSQANCFITLIDLYRALGGGWVLEADVETLFIKSTGCTSSE
jgi:outer membrane protein, multidrug efflux system